MSQQKFSKKFYIILTLILTLVFTTKALASLTFTSDAITGTAASTIDVGSGNALSLQTTNNGNIITGSGNFGIGTASPTYALTVPKDVRFGNDLTAAFGSFVEQRLGLGVATKPTSDMGGNIWGVNAKVTIDNTQTTNATAIGLAGNLAINSGAVMTNASTLFGQAIVQASMTDVKGIEVSNLFAGAGTVVTNSYGVFVRNLVNSSSTITNTYGLYIGDQSIGTQTNTPFSLYSSDANAYNYFAGNVGIATTVPTEALDINSNNIRVRTAKTPASSSDTCDQGEISWDASFIYVCTATDTWKRSAISTW